MPTMKAITTQGVMWLRSLAAGLGTATFVPEGVINAGPNANVGTDADTNEKNLALYSIPANTLRQGMVIEVYAFGICAANANVKTVRARFGAAMTTIFSGAVNGSMWWVRFTVRQRTTGNQAMLSRGGFATSLSTVTSTTIAVDETAAIDFRMTGQNGTAAADDIVLHGAIFSVKPAP